MNVWRLISHHDKPDLAVRRYRRDEFLAIGWGKIGDLRSLDPTDHQDIAQAIQVAYPHLQNSGQGGRCLWAFLNEMSTGDLVILSDGKRRVGVFEVNGD